MQHQFNKTDFENIKGCIQRTNYLAKGSPKAVDAIRAAELVYNKTELTYEVPKLLPICCLNLNQSLINNINEVNYFISERLSSVITFLDAL